MPRLWWHRRGEKHLRGQDTDLLLCVVGKGDPGMCNETKQHGGRDSQEM